MVQYYVQMALRNQAKNKIFSVVNLLGLTIGLAVTVLIINYVSFEFSFDKMHSKKDRIYRVESRFYEGDRLTDDWATSTFGYGSAISKEMTGVEDYVRIGIHQSEQVVSYKDERSRETGIAYAGHSFFKIFDYKLKSGAINDQLIRPKTIVITENVAKRYFRNEDPIGKLMTFANGSSFSDYEVTGVLEDFPANSHIRFNYLISYESLPNWTKEFWYLHEAYTYLLLQPKKNPAEIESQFPAVAEKYKTLPALKNKIWAITLVPLTKIHLNPQKQYEKELKGNKQSLITLIIIAFIILLTAWINYINLTTARALERAREIGIRMVVGATKLQLIRQFLVEACLINLAAAGLAILLIFVLQPSFNQLTGENIGMFILKQPLFWLSSMAVLLGGIGLSGLYPAYVMSHVEPASILKSNYMSTGSAGTTRRVLVIFQFAAALFLICGSFIVYKQVMFMQKQDLGVNINRIIVVKFPVKRSGLMNQVTLFAENLRQEQAISAVSITGAVPGMEVAFFSSNQLQGNSADQSRLYEMLTVDDQFVESFGFNLIAGRSFQKGFGNDRDELLINEACLPALGIQAPEEAPGKMVMLEAEARPVKIIGVVKNWHQRGLGNSYTPVMFVPNGRLGWVRPRYIVIRNNGHEDKELLNLVKSKWQGYFPEASFDYFFLNSFFDNQYKADKRFGKIVAIFTLISFFISALGLWALATFTVSRKIKEVGVRKVLGASNRNILVLFSSEIIVLILIALAIATPFSYIVMKDWLNNYAFRMAITPWIYVGGGVITIGIAMITIGWQSWKASIANPVEALRNE